LNIRILQSALDDLAHSADFYERQAEGLGSYFTSSLISDIDSLQLYAGIHRIIRGYHRMLSKRFPYASITKSKTARLSFTPLSIVVAAQVGSHSNFEDVSNTAELTCSLQPAAS
jgi:hypothetical protein